MAHFFRSMNSSTMCENCGVQPKFAGHDYCGKTCAAEAARKRKAAPQRMGTSLPPFPVVEPDASDLCENCYARPKSQEIDEDGSVITQPYCGVRCSLTSQRSILPVSNIPAPAAAPISRNLSSLLLERASTPIGHSILRMMQDHWQSEELGTPQLKTIYQIDLSKQIYRRFDLALQMNDGCPVTATYYGGIATCSIANDKDPAPCGSQSCQVCDVLCNAFGNMPCGASSREGAYGPGLYTYKNPALAHHVAISDEDHQTQDTNYVLIQCRVVTRGNHGPGSKSFAGSIDDSGATFCAQSAAIIPTHLLIYRLNALADTQRLGGSVNVNLASIGQTVSAATHASASLGQPKSSTNTGSSEPKLKAAKGKGKARAKGPIHQGEGSGGTGSGHGEGNATSGTGSSALPVPLPPPLQPATGDTTQTPHRAGSINTGMGPAVPPPSPTLRGLPNRPASSPDAAKQGAGRDQLSPPPPPTPVLTPASRSGARYLTAAQERAQLAAKNQAVPPPVLNAPQSSGSNGAHGVQAPKTAPREDPFGDEEDSLVPPPSYETGSASGHMQQAVDQSSLASPGPGSFYVHTAAGFIPIPNPPPPGISLFVLGPDGRFYQAPNPSAAVVYPPIPAGATLLPASVSHNGLLGTPAPDPATAALRAMFAPKPQESPETMRTAIAATARNYMSRSQGLNSRLDEDEDDDSNFLNPDGGLARRR